MGAPANSSPAIKQTGTLTQCNRSVNRLKPSWVFLWVMSRNTFQKSLYNVLSQVVLFNDLSEIKNLDKQRGCKIRLDKNFGYCM